MPYSNQNPTTYLGASSAEKLNSATLYKPGELGSRIVGPKGAVLQTVLSDSGPASIASGDVAFWISRSAYTVTNKLADAPLGRNGVAGVFQATVTPGYYCRIQIGGETINPVNCGSAGVAQGMLLEANSGTNKDTVAIPAGTSPSYIVLGIADATGLTNSKIAADITIGAMSVTP